MDEAQITRIFQKDGVCNRQELAMVAIYRGISNHPVNTSGGAPLEE
jgi:hypothetical protein